jgi:mannosyltransferase
MMAPDGGAVVRRRSRVTPAAADEDSASYDAGPIWMRVLPPAAMLVIGLWRITGPSYWRDEAATLSAVQRPFAELVRMTGHIDAVHGTYYMLIWVLVRLGGPGELVTRLPSALAMAASAAAVAALGRRLVSPRAGLASGLMFAVLPQVSLYAQDAREYAMITALAAAGSYVLVRALTTAARRRGWLVCYAFCLGVMGLLNVFSLLLIGAHAVTVALAWRRASRAGGAGERAAARSLAAGWAAAAVGAVLVASPALALGFEQRGTLGWLTTPHLVGAIVGLRRLVGPSLMLLAVAAAVALGILLPAAAGRSRQRASWPPELAGLCGPWLLLPPAVLIGVSYLSPVYTFRYVMFCAPAAALIVGAGLAALSDAAGPVPAWLPAAAAFAVIAVLGVPAQLSFRAANGHGNNIRGANAIVAAHWRPGDAVLYVGTGAKYMPAAYPGGFAKLDNIAQAQTPTRAGNLIGTQRSPAVVEQRLSRVHRVWLARIGRYPHNALYQMNFRLVRIRRVSNIWVLLYERR